jgi:hypothetical protein
LTRPEEIELRIVPVLATLALLATPALAQQAGHQGMNHQGMDHSKMMQPTAANPYGPAEMDMHQKMMAAKGADAGETWIRKMIEHHRGAVAMSQIALRSSQNAEVRGEAQKAITSQNREIATLNAMLRKMGSLLNNRMVPLQSDGTANDASTKICMRYLIAALALGVRRTTLAAT